jgi:ribosomal protein L21
MKYVVAEIAGKQVKIYPNKPFEIDLETDLKEIPSKVLLSVNGKVEIGRPYLKDTVNLKVLETKLGEKIRVAKYHAKANYRRIKGHRKHVTKLVLEAKA